MDAWVPPVVQTQRRVPLNLRDDIKQKPAYMVLQGVIGKIREVESTAWVNR